MVAISTLFRNLMRQLKSSIDHYYTTLKNHTTTGTIIQIHLKDGFISRVDISGYEKPRIPIIEGLSEEALEKIGHNQDLMHKLQDIDVDIINDIVEKQFFKEPVIDANNIRNLTETFQRR